MPLTTRDNLDGTHEANLTITAVSAIVLDTLFDAGWYIYNRGRWQVYIDVDGEMILVEWPDLTKDQQLEVLSQELRYVMKEMAKSYHTNTASTVARDAAIIEAETKYIEVTDE